MSTRAIRPSVRYSLQLDFGLFNQCLTAMLLPRPSGAVQDTAHVQPLNADCSHQIACGDGASVMLRLGASSTSHKAVVSVLTCLRSAVSAKVGYALHFAVSAKTPSNIAGSI